MSDAAVHLEAEPPVRADAQALRVLLVVEAAGGGTGRHVLDLASGLCRRGHAVSLVYCPRRAEQEFVQRAHSIKSLDLHPHDMGRNTGLRDVSQVLSLRRWIRSSGPFDVAHAHSSKAGGVMRLALLGIDIPCVYTPHAFATLDPALNFVGRAAFGSIERLLSARSDAIICVSEHEQRHAERLGIPRAKLRVVHNGIAGVPPADRGSARTSLGLSDDAICIGTVGRFVRQKAIDRLIEAFGLMCQAQPQLRLAVVGEGPELAALKQCVHDLGIGNRVVFATSTQGSRMMAAFDIFALSSTYEAFPYVLLEAACRGLPIVMTDTGGAGVVVRDGENGFVCRQNDVEAFAARLSELVKRAELRARMGQRSAELVTRFRVDPMVDSTLEIYREVIRRRRQ